MMNTSQRTKMIRELTALVGDEKIAKRIAAEYTQRTQFANMTPFPAMSKALGIHCPRLSGREIMSMSKRVLASCGQK